MKHKFNDPTDVFKKTKQRVKELEEDRVNNICERCHLKDDANIDQICKFCNLEYE
jgi:hypothetical protein